jgi:hypothetical protein
MEGMKTPVMMRSIPVYDWLRLIESMQRGLLTFQPPKLFAEQLI